MELLYVDDLVLVAESEKLLLEKLRKRKKEGPWSECWWDKGHVVFGESACVKK